MSDLYQRSIAIILQNQSASGAYVASPNFPTYRYCWYRDGAFIAYAMDLVGEHASARKFHGWATRTLLRHAVVARRAVSLWREGKALQETDILHTRFRLDGEKEAEEEWPNFQLDGFGTWLWSWVEHHLLSGSAPTEDERRAAALVADYLSALWQLPCYDCWEEFPNQIHPHTLAAIYGGLKAHARLAECDHSGPLDQIMAFVQQNALRGGNFVKFVGSNTVDASLLGLSIPYRLVDPADLRMRATVDEIERCLAGGGGLHRYPTDTYYGGGVWVLLAGWLGWYYAETKQLCRSRELLQWIEIQSDEDGQLPEQVPTSLIDASHYQPWIERWGPVAKPLLWSHAMYLILHQNLRGKGET